jgi:hypothetical protein
MSGPWLYSSSSLSLSESDVMANWILMYRLFV